MGNEGRTRKQENGSSTNREDDGEEGKVGFITAKGDKPCCEVKVSITKATKSFRVQEGRKSFSSHRRSAPSSYMLWIEENIDKSDNIKYDDISKHFYSINW